MAGRPQGRVDVEFAGGGCGLRVVSSAGDYGDLVYCLPAAKRLGGGGLRLFPAGYTNARMTPARAESLATLLRCQDYVTGCQYADGPAGTNLDGWRRHARLHLNIADAAAVAHGVPPWPREQPWLTVAAPRAAARVVFHRSPRYRNPYFPWRRVYAKYGRGRSCWARRGNTRTSAPRWGRWPTCRRRRS